MVRKNDFLLVLSAATLLIIIFSTMFLAARVKTQSEVRTSHASSGNLK